MSVGLRVYIHHMCAMPTEVRGSAPFHGTGVKHVVRYHVGPGNRILIFYDSSEVS